MNKLNTDRCPHAQTLGKDAWGFPGHKHSSEGQGQAGLPGKFIFTEMKFLKISRIQKRGKLS